MGFTHVAEHRNAPLALYRQGGVNFVVNRQPTGFAHDFVAAHGPCCTGFALRVDDADAAYQHCLQRSAQAHPAAAELAIAYRRCKASAAAFYTCAIIVMARYSARSFVFLTASMRIRAASVLASLIT